MPRRIRPLGLFVSGQFIPMDNSSRYI
jgi:hypothetical protein